MIKTNNNIGKNNINNKNAVRKMASIPLDEMYAETDNNNSIIVHNGVWDKNTKVTISAYALTVIIMAMIR